MCDKQCKKDCSGCKPKIAGYRVLSTEELDLINEIKKIGEEIQKIDKKIFDYHIRQIRDADIDESSRLYKAETKQWAEEAKRHVQIGLMCYTRSVAQPTNF